MRIMFFLMLSNLLKRKSILLSLFSSIILIGVFATLSHQSFLFLQAQNVSQLSVFNEIIKPLSGLVLLTQLIIGSLTASQLMPYYYGRGQQGGLLHSSFSSYQLVLSNFLIILSVSLVPFLYFLLIVISYSIYSDIDFGLVSSTCIALLIGNSLFSLLMLAVTLSFKKSLIALIVAISSISVVLGLDELLRYHAVGQHFSLFLNLFIHLRDGLVIPFELMRTLCWVLFFLSLITFLMQRLRLQKKHQSVRLLAFSFLSLMSIGVVSLSNKTFQWDISREKLNSLSENIAEQLAHINSPIIVTAVIDDEQNHDEIRKAFDVLKRYHSNLSLVFSNRQALTVQSEFVDQFVMVEINGQQQSIRYPFERSAKDSLLQMVNQLVTRSDQWITFIEGHNEASPFGKKGRDVSAFYQSLKELDWPVAIQNLSKQNVISENTQVLVIADSRKQWLQSEVDSLMTYLHKGGNLLLLREAGDYIPEELKKLLSIKTVVGSLIDWQGFQSGTPHPAVLIVNQFSDHPINTNIDSLLAFPWSVGLSIDEHQPVNSYQYQVITKTHVGVWNEFDSEKSELSYNADQGELQQAFNVAYGIKNRTSDQRMVVVGDSSFLSDSAINNYANRQFALNIISWLSSQSTQRIETSYKDNYIEVDYLGYWLLNWLFSLIMPTIMLLALVWWRRQNSKKSIKNNGEKTSEKKATKRE